MTSSHCYYKYGLVTVESMSRPSQENEYLVAFGKHLAEVRKARGMTQEQLSEKTGLAVDSIGAIEQGRRWVRLTTLHKLAEGLGVPTDELFKGL